MKRTTQYIIVFLLIQFCTLNGFSKKENDFNKNRDSIETYVLEIINPQIFKIIDFIDSTSQNCLFYKENIPFHKMVFLKKTGNVEIIIEKNKFCYFDIIQLYSYTNNGFIGYFKYNDCYHYVMDFTDSLYRDFFSKKEKCILSEFSDLNMNVTYEKYNSQIVHPFLSFYFKNVNNSLIYYRSYDCFESIIQIPQLNRSNDIEFKTSYSEYAPNLIIINSPYFEGLHYGRATLEIEFDNIKKMNVIRLVKCQNITIYDKNNNYKFNFFITNVSSDFTAEEEIILQSLLIEIEKKIREVDFYVLNRSRWYDKIIKPKKKRNKTISKIEYLDINLVINPNPSQ